MVPVDIALLGENRGTSALDLGGPHPERNGGRFVTNSDAGRGDGAERSTVDLMSRMVAGIQDLAWQGLLSERDAMMFTDRVRRIAESEEN